MAAVLAIARTMKALADRGVPKRRIQFAFFNAEEVGRIGSKQYARNLARRRAAVAGMIELDSIGYCPAGARHGWEIHAGHPDAATRILSAEIAGVIEAQRVSLADTTLLPAKMITAPLAGGRYAASDHVSFQDQGVPACVVTQNYTSGPGNRNPHIHSTKDTLDHLNLGYAAAITRVVAAAVWTLANR
jgi:Zn-dependent M28 family amino/carboxypeptidase